MRFVKEKTLNKNQRKYTKYLNAPKSISKYGGSRRPVPQSSVVSHC